MDNHFARRSMIRRDVGSILKNGGGRSNPKNQYYIGHIESLCEGIEGWNISNFIDLDALTPQLTTSEIPLPSGAENTPVTADIPTSEETSDHDQATAFTPLPIIQISRANICKLKTCFNEIPETRKDYCSDSCRIKFNNQNRSKKTA